jgi:pyridoxine/pyridoxamine 5'-phosphate oxidase
MFPILQFHKWFDDASSSGLREPIAMALSIVGKDAKSYVTLLLLFIVDGLINYVTMLTCMLLLRVPN